MEEAAKKRMPAAEFLIPFRTVMAAGEKAGLGWGIGQNKARSLPADSLER